MKIKVVSGFFLIMLVVTSCSSIIYAIRGPKYKGKFDLTSLPKELDTTSYYIRKHPSQDVYGYLKFNNNGIFYGYSSFEKRYFYRGISNDTIIKIERINGGFGSLLTDCFLDSTSKELYSGIVVSYFNSYPQDTITVLNGKANGLTKEYRYNIYSGYTFIGYTYVFETNNRRVEVSKYDYYIETNGSFRVNLRYKSKDATSCTYDFDFKKRKINVVKTLNNNKKFRKKLKNNALIPKIIFIIFDFHFLKLIL